MTNIRDALQGARNGLAKVSSSPSLDAQLLLCDVLEVYGKAYLFAHPEQELTPAQRKAYTRLVARRAAGEPVAYIRGVVSWYDREFAITSDVLIPRPETELLLEQSFQRVQQQPTLVAADVGTGSGAIAITLAAHAPKATIFATDISEAALEVALKNAEANDVEVAFMQGDLVEPLRTAGIKLDVLLSNPPYIATGTLAELDVGKHEPHLALDGGEDGLDVVRRLLDTALTVCNPGALILVEIGADQGDAAMMLAEKALDAAEIEVVPDLAGLDRVLKVLLN